MLVSIREEGDIRSSRSYQIRAQAETLGGAQSLQYVFVYLSSSNRVWKYPLVVEFQHGRLCPPESPRVEPFCGICAEERINYGYLV